MNCEKGDLARVINDPNTRLVGLVDLIVRVTGVIQSKRGEPAWAFEGPSLKCRCRFDCGEVFDCIPDALLRPIRDPGDDAVDETLLRFKIPEFDTV